MFWVVDWVVATGTILTSIGMLNISAYLLGLDNSFLLEALVLILLPYVHEFLILRIRQTHFSLAKIAQHCYKPWSNELFD